MFLICCVLLSGRLRIEKYLREKARKASLEKQTQAKLKEKFPQMKASTSWNFKRTFYSRGVLDSCEPDICPDTRPSPHFVCWVKKSESAPQITEGGLKLLSDVEYEFICPAVLWSYKLCYINVKCFGRFHTY